MDDDQNTPQNLPRDFTEDDDLKHQAAKPPSVLGEEDVFSGDMAGGEPADIDEELAKVGLPGDSDNGPRSLDVKDELDY